ncbi:hypothetical protein [Pseudoruegeria sp. SHC-113]|uniref:hypothetical protein n=1 Tax=Pseudoruegeria sp. SHC-113 TaxID=2855439 RepID=UPI0021BB0AE3|nr:hypothetical protein [Pseudoruegeria sp. SHC-113]MCT8159857.1 hypothetical protein [Pseudoruegeria sp. SHC-113]
MPHPTKIATCCYCGTRAALVLTGQERHELACSGCGAPLHNLKVMPVAKPSADLHHQRPLHAQPSYHKSKKPKKKNKKKKSPARKLFSEAFDLLDDIFD